MIRRGDEFRIGPIRISVMGNNDGRCSALTIYGGANIGTGGTIDEEILDKLAQEKDVTMNRATRKADK